MKKAASIKAILESDKVTSEVLKIQDKRGRTPVMYIANLGNRLKDLDEGATQEHLIKALLESEHITAEMLDTPDENGDTPVMRIACYGSEGVIKALLESDKVTAEMLDTPDKNGDTPLMEIISIGLSNEITAEMLNTPDKISNGDIPVMRIGRSEGVIKALLNSEHITAEILNTPDKNGDTPLMEIISIGSEELLKALLNSEHITAEILNTPDADGKTPLMEIISIGSEELLKALLNSEHITAEILNTPNLEGQTLMMEILDLYEAKSIFAIDRSTIIKALLDSGKLTSDMLMEIARNGSEGVIKALLESKKVTPDVRRTLIMLMEIAQNYSELDIKALLESEHITSKVLNTPDKTGRTLMMDIAHYGSEGSVKALIESEKVTLKELVQQVEGVGDALASLKVRYVSEPPSKEVIESDLKSMIDSGRYSDFKEIVVFSKRALLVAARNFETNLVEALSMDPIMDITTENSDTVPTPRDDIDISELLTIGESTPLDLRSIRQMIKNIKDRTPIVGLPNYEKHPEKFEKAYFQIEKSLKVITTVIQELHAKKEASSDAAITKDLKERLEFVYSRLNGISQACGTRYSQDLPRLYHELTTVDDLDCIQKWQNEKIDVPSFHSDPKKAIKAHLAPLLYRLKMDNLSNVYESTRSQVNRGDVHELSSFWKAVKEPFHLDEGVDTDPLASRYYHVSIDVLKDKFLQLLKSTDIISRLKKEITASEVGGDNPYTSLLSQLATQSGEDVGGVLMKAFQMDEDTYEYRDMTDGFIALCLIEAGLAKL